MIFYSLSALVFILDLLIKAAIKNSMAVGQSIPIIKNILHITYVRNTGAAFGILTGKAEFLIPVGFIIMAVILYLQYKMPNKNIWLRIAFGFIFGGSLGNMFDRLFLGYVVDFIDFRVFPVFNLADTMINIGVLIIIIRIVLFDSKSQEA